ncbi:MAG: hypothetical protein ACYC6A_19340 [Armatimonadota bacterium]
MKPIITSEERFQIFPIMHGRDPRVYPAIKGSIMIERDEVEITLRIPLVIRLQTSLFWRRINTAVTSVSLGAFVIFYMVMMLLAAAQDTTAVWFFALYYGSLILAGIVSLPLFRRSIRLAKSMVAHCYRDGQFITVSFHEKTCPFEAISFLTKTMEDAATVEEALTQSGKSLDGPLSFSPGIRPIFRTEPQRKKLSLIYSYAGQGSITRSSDTISISGTVYSDSPDWNDLRRGLFRALPFLGLIALVAIVEHGPVFRHQNEGWTAGVGLICGLAIFYQLLLTSINFRKHRHVDIPATAISEIKRAADFISFAVAVDGVQPKYCTLYALCNRNADRIYRALQTDNDAATEYSFPIAFSPSGGKPNLYDFFGPGYIQVSGSDLSISGKRRDTDLRRGGFRLWAGIIYGLCIILMLYLYPVTLGPLLPGNVKGLMVIAIPTLLLTLLGAVVLPMAPAFITRTTSFGAYEIYCCERRGRQLSLVIREHDGLSRYDFFTETEEEAKAIEDVLSNIRLP